MKRHFIFSTIIALGVAALSFTMAGEGQVTWTKYTNAELGVSATFPAATEELKSNDNGTDQCIVTANVGDVSYALSVMTSKESYEGIMSPTEVVTAYNLGTRRIVESRDVVKQSGISGIEARLDSPGDEKDQIMRAFVKGNRIIKCLVFYPADKAPDQKIVDKFFKSLKIE